MVCPSRKIHSEGAKSQQIIYSVQVDWMPTQKNKEAWVCSLVMENVP